MVVTAPGCSGADSEPERDASSGLQEAGVADGAVAGADLTALGTCGSWSSWKATGSAGYVCEHTCGKYTLQCTSGVKGGACACTDMVPTGRWGGGSYSFCKQASTGDPDDCRRSMLEGCCLPLAK